MAKTGIKLRPAAFKADALPLGQRGGVLQSNDHYDNGIEKGQFWICFTLFTALWTTFSMPAHLASMQYVNLKLEVRGVKGYLSHLFCH